MDSRFTIIRRLGRGGTAEVAEAVASGYRHHVALKFPLPDEPNSPGLFRKLARREYHLIGGLRFPGLVRLLEKPIEDNHPSLVMELCPGPTLDIIEKPTTRQALTLLSAIAIDLEFLNAAGLVHGDLKPGNVFLPLNWVELVDNSDLFWTKLSDFSLGRFFNEDESARAGLGTVGYMAPETITDHRTSHRSDLFALGVIAYQLLTGRHPYLHDDPEPVRVNSRIREETPPPPSSLNPDLDTRIDELVGSLLAREESERPTGGIAVCRQLAEWGVRYPFESALRPTHLIRSGQSYKAAIASSLNLDQAKGRSLDLYSRGKVVELRRILTIAARRGDLAYGQGRFHFVNPVYWPYRCRAQLLDQFSNLPFRHKKALISASVLQKLRHSEGHNETCLDDATKESLASLLLPLLRQPTVRRISDRLADAVQSDDPALASLLFVRAGRFEQAEQTAQEAGYMLHAEHKTVEALHVLQEVIRYGEIIGRVFETRRLLMQKADFLKDLGDTSKALATYERIIGLYRSESVDTLLALAYKNLGSVYHQRQDFEQALASLEKAREIYEQLGDQLAISHVHNNIGNMYWLMADWPGVMRNYRQALRLQRKLDAKSAVASTLNNIGNAYGVQGRYARCLHLLNQSLKLKKELGDPGEIARTLNNLSCVYHLTGENQKAVSNIKESLQINRRIGSKRELLFNIKNLGILLIHAGHLEEAVSQLQDGITLADELNDRPHLGSCNVVLATAYWRRAQLLKATDCLNRAQLVSDEIDNPILGIELLIQQGYHQLAVGNRDKAEERAQKSLSLAVETHDKENELSTLLLLTRLRCSAELMSRAQALTEDLHLHREKNILRFIQLEHLLASSQAEATGRAAAELHAVATQVQEDIEIAWMCNLLAEAYLNTNDTITAGELLSRASGLARQIGLKPELAVSYTLLGRRSKMLGEWEEAFAHYQKSLHIHKKIAGSIANPDEQETYRQKRMVTFLAGEIRGLSNRLGTKKKGR